MARYASVGVPEMPMPPWLSGIISAQRWSTTGTAPSTRLNTRRMPLERYSLLEPARGIAMWVASLLALNASLNTFFILLSNLLCFQSSSKANEPDKGSTTASTVSKLTKLTERTHVCTEGPI